MSNEVKEECGIAAVADLDPKRSPTEFDIVTLLYTLLIKQQNRGALAAGIGTYNTSRNRILERYRELGTVNEAFGTTHPEKFNKLRAGLSGSKGIGHVRYGTLGKDDVQCAQPFLRRHGKLIKKFALAFNGNLANYSQLEEMLKNEHGYSVESKTDTEIILHCLSLELKSEGKSWKDIFFNLSEMLDGAYNIVFLNGKGDVIVSRDPFGFKPLCYGVNRENGIFAAASESVALERIGVKDFYDLEPGHLIHVKNRDIEIIKYSDPKRISHCMFEWIYFANICSVINGKAVDDVRFNLGCELAKSEKIRLSKAGTAIDDKFKSDYIVCGVPSSAIPIAEGFGYELGIPSSSGLIRIDVSSRTFISHKEDKKTEIKNKFDANRSVLCGKNAYLIDDSIVRGNTSREIVDYVRNMGGAKEIHFRSACPPIAFPCFYGIDISTISELIAGKNISNKEDWQERGPIAQEIVEKIRRHIGADSLVYQTMDGLVKSVGLPKEKLCLSCLNGDHPTDHGKVMREIAISDFLNGRSVRRTYELVK